MTDEKPPKHPSTALLALSRIGWIHGIEIRQQQTGTDSADAFCVITGSDGKCEGLWNTYSQYLTIRPFHNGIAMIAEEHGKALERWKAYAHKEARDLSEYERLKKKFGDW